MGNKIRSILIFIGLWCIAINTVALPALEPAATLQRIHLLEQAFYPHTPDMVAKLFAKAVMKRNGAIQFMLLAPELQQKFHASFDELNWITGVSSPQVASYDVVNTEQAAQQWKFALHFSLEYAGGKPYACINHITVGQIADPSADKQLRWEITELEFLDPVRACPFTSPSH